MNEESKSAGEYRQMVYRILENAIGREMTNEEHQQIRTVLIAYVKSQTEPLLKTNQLLSEDTRSCE